MLMSYQKKKKKRQEGRRQTSEMKETETVEKEIDYS
jgi:hypothetical protein